MKERDAKVIVVGTGPAGMAAALLTAQSGWPVCLVGPEPDLDDRRTTALMVPSLRMLDGFGLLDRVREASAPLKTMRILDGTSRIIRAPAVSFHAGEIGEEAFGYNIPNRVLNGSLIESVQAQPDIAWIGSKASNWDIRPDSAGLECAGTRITGKLVIAADGRSSPARTAAGISTVDTTYDQTAVVCEIGHAREHGFASTEFHTETGPLTIVPLPGKRSSIVWIVRPRQAQELMALSGAEFETRLETRMASILGRVTLDGKRQAWPLSVMTPARFAKNRVALVGEAAHVFPPIGAQGLNLGMRDVAEIVRLIGGNAGIGEDGFDPGSPQVLAEYDRLRRPDILQRTAAVHSLNMSLLSGLVPVQLLRAAGLQALSSIAPLRAAIMREGLTPGSGVSRLLRHFTRRETDRPATSRSS